MSSREIRLERNCCADAGRLWQVLVQPSIWWGEEVSLSAQKGGALHEPWRDAAGDHHTRGEVLAIDAPRHLRLSWRDDDWTFATQVAFTLTQTGTGSRISLGHTGWEEAPPEVRDSLLASHRDGWAIHLSNLIACAESLADPHTEKRKTS